MYSSSYICNLSNLQLTDSHLPCHQLLGDFISSHINILSSSLLLLAVLEALVGPRCHGDHLVGVLRARLGRVSRGDAVVAFARGAHALAVARARLIELHGGSVLRGHGRRERA